MTCCCAITLLNFKIHIKVIYTLKLLRILNWVLKIWYLSSLNIKTVKITLILLQIKTLKESISYYNNLNIYNDQLYLLLLGFIKYFVKEKWFEKCIFTIDNGFNWSWKIHVYIHDYKLYSKYTFICAWNKP